MTINQRAHFSLHRKVIFDIDSNYTCAFTFILRKKKTEQSINFFLAKLSPLLFKQFFSSSVFVGIQTNKQANRMKKLYTMQASHENRPLTIRIVGNNFNHNSLYNC
ncbi:hypothetical protein Dimus_001981 [Dionaea muscipula]